MTKRKPQSDSLSCELHGFPIVADSIDAMPSNNEHLIPECLRGEYENWVVSEMPFL